MAKAVATPCTFIGSDGSSVAFRLGPNHLMGARRPGSVHSDGQLLLCSSHSPVFRLIRGVPSLQHSVGGSGEGADRYAGAARAVRRYGLLPDCRELRNGASSLDRVAFLSVPVGRGALVL